MYGVHKGKLFGLVRTFDWPRLAETYTVFTLDTLRRCDICWGRLGAKSCQDYTKIRLRNVVFLGSLARHEYALIGRD